MLSSWFPDAVLRGRCGGRFSFRFSSLFSSCSGTLLSPARRWISGSPHPLREGRLPKRRVDGTSRYSRMEDSSSRLIRPSWNQPLDRPASARGVDRWSMGLTDPPAACSGDLADPGLGSQGEPEAFPDLCRGGRRGTVPVPPRIAAGRPLGSSPDKIAARICSFELLGPLAGPRPWGGTSRRAFSSSTTSPRLGSKSFPDGLWECSALQPTSAADTRPVLHGGQGVNSSCWPESSSSHRC